MTPQRHTTLWLLALVAICSVHLGAPCGKPKPPPMIRFDTPQITPINETLYIGTADILVDTTEEYQAFDLTLSWEYPALFVTLVIPHSEFDDDAKFSMPVSIDQGAGTTSAVVDVRHGASVSGPTRVATVNFIAAQGLPGSLWVSGTVAAPDGSLLTMAASPPVTTP